MRTHLLLLTLVLFLHSAQNLSAQSCTPINPFPPGEIILPLPYIDTEPGSGIQDTAFVGVAFETAFYIQCPSSIVYSGITVPVSNIAMATTGGISNLPVGITYSCNPPNCVFTANNPGCISIYGTATPPGAGFYDLLLSVTAGTPLGAIPFQVPGTLVAGNYFLHVKDCPVYDMQETAAVCAGETYTFPDGTTAEIFANTSYTSTLTAASGCDSLITTAVEVIAVETAVSQDGNTLTANASNSSFQWIDCADNQAIANETNDSFTPAVSGNYAVIVTTGNCQDTSACFNVVINGVSQPHIAPQMRISPNPAGNAIQVVLPHLDAPASLSIRDTKGQEVLSQIIPSAPSCVVDISSLSPGMFFLILQTENTVSITKFLKYQ